MRRLFMGLAALSIARADMDLFKFDAASTGAMCTDGSPAGFYFEASGNGDNSRWVIELEGGGICESNADCVSRQGGDLGSSKNWAASITVGGQNSKNRTSNPDFADFNHVFVPYCTGDIWQGMQPEAVNPWGGPGQTFVFTGHTIVQAVVAKLIEYVGGAGGVSELLLEGCSAGGIGSFVNADWVAAQFPSAKVRANPQAGYFGLGISRYDHWLDNTTDPDPHHFADNGWLANVTVYQNPAVAKCMAADPTASALDCGEPPRFYPFTTTPMFVSENTADSYQVFVQGKCPQSQGPGPEGFVSYLHGILAGSLHSNVIKGAKKKTDGLYAPACLAHCLAWNGDGAPTINGKTHQQAMGDWYFGRGLFNSHMSINDDDNIDTLLSCTDYAAGMAREQLKVQLAQPQRRH